MPPAVGAAASPTTRGVPTAVYTANPDDARRAVVALARSDRSLLSWQQDDAAVVATPVRPGLDEVRDPFVFSYDGRRYAVQGAGHRNGRPQLLVWACDDLTQWQELGALLTDDDPVAAQLTAANIWECPNLVRIDDQWVLLLSLWAWANDTHRLVGVRYLLGDLVADGIGLRFKATSSGVLDNGPAFYAPQVLPGTDRTLLWGWAWEIGRTPDQIIHAGWAGMLTFPRELFVRDGDLCSRPAAELTGLRSAELSWQQPFQEHAFEIVANGPTTLRLIEGNQQRHGGRGDRLGARPGKDLRRWQHHRDVRWRRGAHHPCLPERLQSMVDRSRRRSGTCLPARCR